MGLLGAGLVMPDRRRRRSAVTRTGVDMFDALPERVHRGRRCPSSRRSSTPRATSSPRPHDENRIIVPLDQVAPIMQKAQVAIEDSRFYEHGGVDLRGVVRALVSTLRGGRHLRVRPR